MMSRFIGLSLAIAVLSNAPVIAGDAPGVSWSFEKPDPASGRLLGTDEQLAGKTNGNAKIANGQLVIEKGAGRIVVADPGDDSLLDAKAGDAVTLVAWVNPQPGAVTNGRHLHIIGKGRTGNAGFAADNLNYALRLTGTGNRAAVSFVFRSAPGGDDAPGGDWHRWTSVETLPADGGWHHVAVSYRFGDPATIQGFIDGSAVEGRWDMGGETAAAPVVDNDELWIGSGAGGGSSSTFHGALDEVALHKRLVSPDDVAAWRELVLTDKRFRPAPVVAEKPPVPLTPAPTGRVLVEIFENLPTNLTWKFRWPEAVEHYSQDSFGFIELRHKYSAKAVRADRSPAFGIRASSLVELPAGEYEVLVRARNGSKLWVDGKVVAETPFHRISSSAHGNVKDVRVLKEPHLRRLQPGDNEAVAKLESDGSAKEIRLELYVGGNGKRPETGEAGVFVRRVGETDFRLLGHAIDYPLTDAGMIDFHRKQRVDVVRLDGERRRELGKNEDLYWQRRHEIAREIRRAKPSVNVPEAAEKDASDHPIDRFVDARLAEAGATPTRLIDDWSFLRRVTLDVIGAVPTDEQAAAFFADKEPGRRERYIDRLLEQPGWADHWVSYWQDALAENPNVVNPTLNNSGPFRWWLYESFLDNKPFDRFATELILMEGSTLFGGPGGFSLATQNDVPMAAKAHVLSQALLAIDMSCARCHDSPTTDLKQIDLFAMAAMLKRGPQDVPETSSVPPSKDPNHIRLIEVSLLPGTKVQPAWNFDELVAPDAIPSEVIRNPNDQRERLAAIITSPHNDRFAQVIVNRLWHRYFGEGLVNSTHNWLDPEPIDPALMAYLCEQLIDSGYDLKALARLILTSQAYQREPLADADSELAGLLPVRRKMTAEQIVDSMFVACGKRLKTGELNMDCEGGRAPDMSLNFGRSLRAWEFVSLSNERDRPGLTLPKVQPFVTLMHAFGWQGERQGPIADRDDDPTVLQPGLLANGITAGRFTRLSDDSYFTQLALEAGSPEELVDATVRRVLGRPPRTGEVALLAEPLRDGFADRVVADAEPLPFRDFTTTGVGWTNQFDPEATRLQVELAAEVAAGDPPTPRLTEDWRLRYEDVLWSLLNSPEFIFLP